LREAWAAHPVLVAGNTVETEEELVLEAWRQAREAHPDLRLVLAPRQPRRFQAVADLFQAKGLRFRRGSGAWPARAQDWAGTDVLLLDTLGELAAAYGEATLALVGGGWAWRGGHNPLEPVRWGVPALLGPGFDNFADLVVPLAEAGLVRVVPAPELAGAVTAALAEGPLRPSRREAAVQLPDSLSGALEKTWELIRKIIPEPR
jgi:3-deoxy-D-manno-octulosonic-acid transferase